MPGPKRQPKEIVQAKGYFRKDRYPLPEESVVLPSLLNGIPPPPDSLGETGREAWTEILPQLNSLSGLLAPVDLRLFYQYCWHLDKMEEFNNDIILNGNFINYNGKTIPNPALSEYRQSEKRVADIGSLFGLNPSSRSSLRIVKPKGQSKFGKIGI